MTKSTITRERLSDILEFGSGRLIKPISDEEIELMARMALTAMDSEPVAWVPESQLRMLSGARIVEADLCSIDRFNDTPLYRHAQQPVVPDDVLAALQKVARIRLDLNDFDGDRRGIADCLGDAEEALIEVVNRRAAMLAASPQLPGSEPATVPGEWIPVSERVPEVEGHYLVWASASRIDGYCDHLAIATYQGGRMEQ